MDNRWRKHMSNKRGQNRALQSIVEKTFQEADIPLTRNIRSGVNQVFTGFAFEVRGSDIELLGALGLVKSSLKITERGIKVRQAILTALGHLH